MRPYWSHSGTCNLREYAPANVSYAGNVGHKFNPHNMDYTMSKIIIRKLNKDKISKLLCVEKHETLHPSSCSVCKNYDGFDRNIFEISGYDPNDESLENVIQETLRKDQRIEFSFIKNVNGQYYADSAICQRCGSTAIIYDVTLSDALINQLCAITGASKETALKDINEITKMIK